MAPLLDNPFTAPTLPTIKLALLLRFKLTTLLAANVLMLLAWVKVWLPPVSSILLALMAPV